MFRFFPITYIHSFHKLCPLTFIIAFLTSSHLILIHISGMDIARLNFSHCSHEFASQVIKDIRDYLKDANSTGCIGIWADINGPKVRYKTHVLSCY